MRHLAIAILLACLLSGTVRAGEVPSTGVVTPQPGTSSGVATGAIPTTGNTQSTGATTTMLAIILTLISSVR